jgi:short subunit dehydrogenase-like uncharacterized protein
MRRAAHDSIGLPIDMTSDPLLVYGATGYTGRLVVERATARGLRPILAGRSAARLEALASSYGCEFAAVPLTDTAALERLLRRVRVAILAAGPFSDTAIPMSSACLRAGTHYLDLTGECAVIESLFTHSEAARRRECMLMPGCGFDVVASDCLAAHVARRLPGASHLALGLSGLVTPTRGSLRTIAEHAGLGVRVRRGGEFAYVPPGTLRRRFDYGRGTGWSDAVTWGDVATAFHTTGIPNVEVYFEETPTFSAMLIAGRTLGPLLQAPMAQTWLKAHAQLFPEGPTATERAVHSCVVVAEARVDNGRTAVARLRTPEAYTFSAHSVVAIAERVMAGDVEFGCQTPGRVYGADFALGVDSVTREDLDDGQRGRRRAHATVSRAPHRAARA